MKKSKKWELEFKIQIGIKNKFLPNHEGKVNDLQQNQNIERNQRCKNALSPNVAPNETEEAEALGTRVRRRLLFGFGFRLIDVTHFKKKYGLVEDLVEKFFVLNFRWKNMKCMNLNLVNYFLNCGI